MLLSLGNGRFKFSLDLQGCAVSLGQSDSKDNYRVCLIMKQTEPRSACLTQYRRYIDIVGRKFGTTNSRHNAAFYKIWHHISD